MVVGFYELFKSFSVTDINLFKKEQEAWYEFRRKRLILKTFVYFNFFVEFVTSYTKQRFIQSKFSKKTNYPEFSAVENPSLVFP